MLKGKPVALAAAIDAARRADRRREAPGGDRLVVGLERGARGVQRGLGRRFAVVLSRRTGRPAPGEPLEDDILIRADKNPNTAAARALFAPLPDPPRRRFPPTPTSCWSGARASTSRALPPKAKIVYVNSYLQPENGHADVFFAASIQTERRGHYTNFEGVVSAFEPCFPKQPGVVDAESLFDALAVQLVEQP